MLAPTAHAREQNSQHGLLDDRSEAACSNRHVELKGRFVHDLFMNAVHRGQLQLRIVLFRFKQRCWQVCGPRPRYSVENREKQGVNTCEAERRGRFIDLPLACLLLGRQQQSIQSRLPRTTREPVNSHFSTTLLCFCTNADI